MPVLYHIPELRRVELEYGGIVGDVDGVQRFSERRTTQVKLIDEVRQCTYRTRMRNNTCLVREKTRSLGKGEGLAEGTGLERYQK